MWREESLLSNIYIDSLAFDLYSRKPCARCLPIKRLLNVCGAFNVCDAFNAYDVFLLRTSQINLSLLLKF